jgi:hypothetical protein
MSNSVSKYFELVEKETELLQSEHQRGVTRIVEILQGAKQAKMRSDLLKQVLKVSKEAPGLSPVTVFQIAADEVKIDELCNKVKY